MTVFSRISLLIVTIIFPILFTQCKTQEYTPYDFEGEILVFGKGGGYTGQSIEYSLLSNGQIFKGTNKEGNVSELKRLKGNQTDQIFSSYHQMKFDNIEMNKPGNLYYYVTFRLDNKEHKIQWGAHDAETPPGLKIFFSNLMATVKSLNQDAK